MAERKGIHCTLPLFWYAECVCAQRQLNSVCPSLTLCQWNLCGLYFHWRTHEPVAGPTSGGELTTLLKGVKLELAFWVYLRQNLTPHLIWWKWVMWGTLVLRGAGGTHLEGITNAAACCHPPSFLHRPPCGHAAICLIELHLAPPLPPSRLKLVIQDGCLGVWSGRQTALKLSTRQSCKLG